MPRFSRDVRKQDFHTAVKLYSFLWAISPHGAGERVSYAKAEQRKPASGGRTGFAEKSAGWRKLLRLESFEIVWPIETV
jgi:hypothetical protein